tara:strand:- start:4631 stop:4810 length:180 start_codon:yes stop_codon:yes gene_type:complete
VKHGLFITVDSIMLHCGILFKQIPAEIRRFNAESIGFPTTVNLPRNPRRLLPVLKATLI